MKPNDQVNVVRNLIPDCVPNNWPKGWGLRPPKPTDNWLDIVLLGRRSCTNHNLGIPPLASQIEMAPRVVHVKTT